MTRLLALLALICMSTSAFADWGENGAAIQCNRKTNTFVIAPVIELSSPGEGAIEVEPGFQRLSEGTHRIACNLHGLYIQAQIRVFGPSPKGMCMGGGYVDIRSLQAGKSKIIPDVEPFNWVCTDPTLIRITIKNSEKAPPTAELCTADNWGWDEGFSGVRCESRSLR
ncbi:hypothetical protein [Uliginosibacterium sp. 31-12]|uniref:hypothetical protein n=1 Tax=Uliginosibacterium sp. 31-12 TaxID=3062781 RepID=UPI0026E2F6B7|nr:hypothetical protein [Uliginosibacterium sp. 31-12]MDO6388471.1 hypothetical protein [Uliginosibacterium sp. 31-12]